jgi:spore maturation protein CgeB
MRLVFFVHSLVSDWNNGNAHFQRGVVRELLELGHEVRVFEPRRGWSRENLLAEEGIPSLASFAAAFPAFESRLYDEDADVCDLIGDADAVVVHEWSPPALVRQIGRSGVTALFHDTHHRSVTATHEMRRFDLSGYAAVLAFGRAVADVYRRNGWHDRVFTWHEAADTRLFRPLPARLAGDLVWIGNWGDDERARELRTFLLEPARRLRLRGTVYGVRYPESAMAAVRSSGLSFGGRLPNHRAPEAFARHRVTVHVPRRPYAERLPGIPTIRVFEALACGIPLVSAPWDDAEGLFTPGRDFLVARDGRAMESALRLVLSDPEVAESLSRSGRETVLRRHTCRHRALELVEILAALGVSDEAAVEEAAA